MKRTLIIAEAGVNHNGCLETAKKLVEKAAHAGADIVKFQTFSSEKMTTSEASLANYQSRTIDEHSQLNMLKKLELTREMHEVLIEHCKICGIEFLSTAFDTDSFDFLSQCGIKRHKIASGEITNLPLLKKIGSAGLPVIMSTGMSELVEIDHAVNILDQAGLNRSQLTLLQCTSEYPAPDEEANLRVMETLKNRYDVAVGYSDHTLGIALSIGAVALGATVIEKHFTLDRKMKGPDHKASIEPAELAELINSIRRIESALGQSNKSVTRSEAKNRSIARKSIVAAKPIKKGECFSELNLAVKRPARGRSPMEWLSIIGKKAERDYQIDECI